MRHSSNRSFERKAEKEVEGLLPKEVRKSVKRFPFLYLLTVFALLIIISVLSVNLSHQNNTLKQQKITLTGLNKQLQTKANILSTLQTNLNKTKAGQATLLAAENKANQKAATSSQQASAAEAQSSKNAAALSATQSQLSSSQSQLSSSQSQLNSVNAKLASAQACVTLFNSSVSPNIDNFNYTMIESLTNADKSITDALNGNYTAGLNTLNTSQSEYNSAQNLYNQIKGSISQIGSGNCG